MSEIWERHPVYPHEGSSLGRIRTLKGRIVAQCAHNRPVDAPPHKRYRKARLWIPATDGGKGKLVTVLVHQFITECRWGLKKHRSLQARHGPGGPADNRWANLLGWGTAEVNNGPDKPREVRVAAATKARAAQLAYARSPEPPHGWLRKVAVTLGIRHSGTDNRRSATLATRPVNGIGRNRTNGNKLGSRVQNGGPTAALPSWWPADGYVA